MSKSSDLLDEMKGIFGGSFGQTGASLISEAQRPKPSSQPSDKGLLAKKKGGALHGNEKSGLRLKDKRAMKSKKSGDEKKFQGVMKDIRGEMDKSKQKSDAKKADSKKSDDKSASGASSGSSSGGKPGGKPGGKSGGGGGRSQHYPFKRSPNLGEGPRHTHHDETKCWKCSCANGGTYAKGPNNGCICHSSGKGDKCPPAGTKKKITIKADYHRAYNDEYHPWRAAQGGAVTKRLGSTR